MKLIFTILSLIFFQNGFAAGTYKLPQVFAILIDHSDIHTGVHKLNLVIKNRNNEIKTQLTDSRFNHMGEIQFNPSDLFQILKEIEDKKVISKSFNIIKLNKLQCQSILKILIKIDANVKIFEVCADKSQGKENEIQLVNWSQFIKRWSYRTFGKK